jgi:peptidoglycan glycosyltransferase
VLPRVAEKIDEPKIAKPTEVVQQQRTALPREVNEFGKLRSDCGAIMVECRSIKQVSFCRPTRRVADHSRSSANQCDGASAVQLEASERKDTHQVSNMKRVGARIKADVSADRRVSDEALIEAYGHVMNETSIGEVTEELRGQRVPHAPYATFTAMNMASGNSPQRARRPRKRLLGGLFALLPVALVGACLLIAAIAYGGTIAIYGSVVADLPNPKDLDTIVLNQNTTVYDRTGTVQLASIGSDRRTEVVLSSIPGYVLDTTTAIEDKTYWENSGFDPLGFVAAAVDTVRGSGRGGSTITQQLVRSVLLPDSAFNGSVYERKVKEIIQAIRLTKEFPGRVGKEKVIAKYLNNNYYGSRSYGILTASLEYFGKTLDQLTLGEAAVLAAIPQAPSKYDLRANAVLGDDRLYRVPLDSAVAKRRNVVLDLLKSARESGIPQETTTITNAEIDAARVEKIILIPPPLNKMRAPHFVNRVRDVLSGILCTTTEGCQQQLETSGYKVVTSLDWTMQQAADQWALTVRSTQVKEYQAYLKSIGIKSTKWLDAIHGLAINNAAVSTLDARTGDILAYTGSADYYGLATGAVFQPQFDVLSGYRQPGSAIKPITYAYALEDRAVTPATILMDVPVDFGQGWTPADADLTERGPVRMRQALMGSLNVPAIKAVIRAGQDRVWRQMRDGAFTFQNNAENVAGASLAIGTLEVRYVDLLSAYGALANEGKMVARRYVLRIEDRHGSVVWEAPAPGVNTKQIFTKETAALMTDIIAGNTDPAVNPVWASRKIVASGGKRRPAAFKTGTTDQTKDLTAFGYLAAPTDPAAQHLVTGAWMGNSDSTPANAYARDSAGGLWQSYFTQISSKLPIASFPQPAGLEQVTIDAHTGELPGPCTSLTTVEYFFPGTAPTTACSTTRMLSIDSATGLLWSSSCAGPRIEANYLDLSSVESEWPKWQAANLEWIERARLGVGIVGGARVGKTQYFYAPYWRPNGATWGGTIAPTRSCEASVPTSPPTP